MKKPFLIAMILLICLSLTGCSFFFPFFFFNFTAPDAPEPTLAVGSDIPAHLSAEDIYYRAKFAAGERAHKHTAEATIGLSYREDDYKYVYDYHYDTQVALSPADCAVNVQTSIYFTDESADVYWEYYRDENGELVCYSYDVTEKEYYRDQIELDGMTPHVIITDYSVRGYPLAPQNLAVDPQTRILGEREVYLLTFTESALYTFGSTGNTEFDNQLNQRNISHTWYVDAETFLPVQQEFFLSQVDDVLGRLIDSAYYLYASEDGIAIQDFSYTLKDMSFTAQQVPEIPDEVYKNAWANSGYSDN